MTDRPSIILATSNGTGMGHLAREAATALALTGRAEPVLFSLSQALPLIFGLGLRGEYCPSQKLGLLPSSSWQRYLARRVQAVVHETGARVFAFDGAWPYAGLEFARASLPGVAFVWVRRGMWKPGVNERALRRRPMFDLVLEPGDLAQEADRGATARLDDAVRVRPVTMWEQIDRLPRHEAAQALGLDPDRRTALVTLRTDSLGDHSAATTAIRTVLDRPGWQVALTRTPITSGDLAVTSDRVVPIRGVFPLARYLSAIDLAVTEAGYNSFHEMLHAGVPSVFVPTSAAVTDDQFARAAWAADNGFARAAPEDDPARLATEVAELLNSEVRLQLSERCGTLPAPTGATQAADALVELAAGFSARPVTAIERVLQVRRAIGRVLRRGHHHSVQGNYRFVERMTTEDLGRNGHVEHLLENASADYRLLRERIATETFGPREGLRPRSLDGR